MRLILGTQFRLFVLFSSLISISFAQNVGINATGAAPDNSAILDVSSTNKGILTPRMTTAQRTAIATPATGLLVFDTTTNTFWFYNGSAWVELASVYTAGQGINITNNVISTTSACGLSIGDTHQGGIIFYLDETGCSGLICGTSDLVSSAPGAPFPFGTPNVTWQEGVNTRTEGDQSCVGCGDGNTNHIYIDLVTAQGGVFHSAAQMCYQHASGGYSDWYLPSKWELNLMYKNIGPGNALGLGNIGNFLAFAYWSSTENGINSAFAKSFANGLTFSNGKQTSNALVRPIRAF